MSHVTALAVEVKNLEAMKKACVSLGLEFREGQKTHKWYGTWVRDYNAEDAAYKQGISPETYGMCEHAIGIPNNDQAYEVGLVGTENGTFKVVYDFYNGGYGLESIIGKRAETLMQEYSVEASKQLLQEQGYFNYTETRTDGKVQLSVRL